MIKNIDQLEKAIGLNQGDFKAMLESPEEKEIPLSDLEIVKKSDLTQRIQNISNGNYEKTIKEYARGIGIEKSVRDIDSFASEYKNKLMSEIKVEPDKKVSELQNDLESLRKNLAAKEEEVLKLHTTFKKEKEYQIVERTLMSVIPEKTNIPREDVFKLASLPNKIYDSYEVNENGALIFKKGGEVLKNSNTLNPLTVNEVMPSFLSPYIKQAEGGGGGTDNVKQIKSGTLEDFNKEMLDKGVNPYSAVWQQEFSKRTSEGTILK